MLHLACIKMRSKLEINKFIQEVVRKTRRNANIDTGFLRRSIRGNWSNNIVTFREVFYGAYNDNAQLVQNAKDIMPSDIPWQVVFVDEDGHETKIEGETRTGRKISRKAITSGNVSTSKIKALIKSIQNAKAKDTSGTSNRGTNEETS